MSAPAAEPGPVPADDPLVRPVRVLVVDDNAVVRSGITSLLQLSPRVQVVGEATNGDQAVELALRLRPDVTLLDVRMPKRDGVAAARDISSHTRVLMMTFTDSPQVVHDALAAGAAGYLVHGTFEEDDLVTCVLAVAAGSGVFGPPALAALREGQAPPATVRPDFDLSTRQMEIMDLVAAGRSNRDIAALLFLAEKTVKNHINHIFARLGVRTRAEAVAVWLGNTSPNELRPL